MTKRWETAFVVGVFFLGLSLAANIGLWIKLQEAWAGPARPHALSPTLPVRDEGPMVMVPQSSIYDVAALSPSERAAFMRGYFSALAAFQVGNPRCSVPWFFEKGGAERMYKALNEAASTDLDENYRHKIYDRPLGVDLLLATFDYCTNRK